MELFSIIFNIFFPQLLGIRYIYILYAIIADYIQPSIKPVYLVIYYFSSTKHLFAITITTSIEYDRKLSNLAKIYTDKRKYNSYNDSFIFKLVIFIIFAEKLIFYLR